MGNMPKVTNVTLTAVKVQQWHYLCQWQTLKLVIGVWYDTILYWVNSFFVK